MSAQSASAAAAAGVEWLDEVGYSANVAQRADVLKIAVQDPRHLWPYLQATFASYQPFQGLQVRNKAGSLQKVEDLSAEIVNMYMREPAGGNAATTNSARGRSSGIFGFGGGGGGGGSAGGSGLSSSAPSREASGSSNLYVSTQPELSIGTSEPASPTASASSLSASLPSLNHPMRWHSYPYLHMLLVSPATVDEYTRTTKPQIKRFLDYFAAPQTASGGSGASTPSSSGGGGGSGFRAASTPSAAGMVVAGSSLVPELRFHSEVLVLYLPLLEGENSGSGPLTPSGSFNSNANSSSSNSSSSGGGGLSSLFRRSTSFSTNASPAAAAEERAQALKQARKVFERMKADFGGSGRDTSNSQVVRIDLHELVRLQEKEAASAAANSAAASGGVANAASAGTGTGTGISASAAAAALAAVVLTPAMIASDSPELVHQLDEFVARVVRALIRTHETRAALYETELRKALANRQMRGWNYCAYFVLQQSYATFHEQMSLGLDALRLYDELRAGMDELLSLQRGGGGSDGGEKRGLRYLLVSPRSTLPPQAQLSQAQGQGEGQAFSSAPMPAPLLDVSSRNYPLLILRGEVTELEFLRYLVAQSIWILFKIARTPNGAAFFAASVAASSASAASASAASASAANAASGGAAASTPGGGGGTSSSSSSSSSSSAASSNPHPLCEILRRGHELIHTMLALISSDPSRFPIAAEAQLAWALEAAMDLGVLCEKFLVASYVQAYQSLTARVLAAQAQAAQAAQPVAREKERASAGGGGGGGGGGFSNVLASAMAAVIGPAAAPAAASPVPAPATPAVSTSSSSSPGPGSSTSSSSSSSLSLQTRALKAGHEADLRALQHLRGDLCAFVLERTFLWGRAHPLLRLRADIGDVLRSEARERLAGAGGAAVVAVPAASPGADASASTSTSPTSQPQAQRIGLDDDVYVDTVDCCYNPHEAERNTHSAGGVVALPRLSASGSAIPGSSGASGSSEDSSPPTLARRGPSELWEARHRRIMACFASASASSSSDGSSGSISGGLSFTALFLELCTACLKMYWLSGRHRLCTRVAEMKAVAYYGCGDYPRALELLLTNCDRTGSGSGSGGGRERWTQLWFPSMVLAIKAQQRMGRHADVVRSCMVFLLTSLQQASSSRFRPRPAPGQPFSWSRLGGIVAAARVKARLEGRARGGGGGGGGGGGHVEQDRLYADADTGADGAGEGDDSSSSASAPTYAAAPKSSPGNIVSPLIPYTFPMLASAAPPTSSSSSSSSSSGSSSLSPVVQVVLVQSQKDASSSPSQQQQQQQQQPAHNSAASSTLPPCNPLLLDCCRHHVWSGAGAGAGADSAAASAIITPEDVQALLVHTLSAHMGPVLPSASDSRGWARARQVLQVFGALRALAHRDQAMSPMFPSPTASVSAAAAAAAASASGLSPQSASGRHRGSLSKAGMHRSSSGNSSNSAGGGGGSGATASQAGPIVVVTPSASRGSNAAAAAAAAGGGQVESESTISVIAEESITGGGGGIGSDASPSPSSPPPSPAGPVAGVLPPGPYVEASAHPFLTIAPGPELYLYRKTHPMHVVLELELVSRWPALVRLDALAVVISARPRGGLAAGDGAVAAAAGGETVVRPVGSPSGAQRRQVSVIVTPASSPFGGAPADPSALQQRRAGAGAGAGVGVSNLEVPPVLLGSQQQQQQPLPSPLPSQSVSASSSHENLSTLRTLPATTDELAVPLSASASAGGPSASPEPTPSPSPSPLPLSSAMDRPTPSPDPVSSFPASTVHTVQLGAQRSSHSASTPPASAVSGGAGSDRAVPVQQQASSSSAEEWECVFEGVSLRPGSNKLYLHVFHAAPVPTEADADAGESVPTATAATEATGAHACSTGPPAQHHSLVLYHTLPALERIHALFEASHAHMVEIVEQRTTGRRGSLSGAAGGGGGGSRRSSLTKLAPPAALPSPSSHVHSPASTILSLRDVWFGLGRLQLWTLDLAALNESLQTHVLTRKQRRSQLAKLARKGAVSLAEMDEVDLGGSSPAAAATVSPAETALVDPHTQSGFTPPVVSFRPFSGKPRLSIELLPVPPAALLLGKQHPFQLAVRVAVGPATPASESGRPALIERCVLHVAAQGELRLFAREDQDPHRAGARGQGLSRQNSDDNGSHSGVAMVHGLLQHRGRSEQRQFPLDLRRGDIALGTLPAGCVLLLLIPVRAPGHLGHLLRTRQITLPSASRAETPCQSRPASPGPAGSAAGSGPERRHARSSSSSSGSSRSANNSPLLAARRAASSSSLGDSDSDGNADQPGGDLHSATHALSLDLTCSPGPSPSPSSAPSSAPRASFMFSAYTSLTFMEPVQLQASMERLGHRWFLQVHLWNRCGYPLALRGYTLHLPKGFALVRDHNAWARGHVLPALPLPAGAGAEAAAAITGDAALPGAAAAALASSVPVSYASPNVYSMVFELAVAAPAPPVEAGGNNGHGNSADPPRHARTQSSRRPSLSLDMSGSGQGLGLGLPDEDAELASSYAWASMGRFALQVDSAPPSLSDPSLSASASPSASLSRSLSLSWPIDIQIMSGAQDLHVVLSFPQVAYMGRLLGLTLTVLHMRGAKGKAPGRGRHVPETGSVGATAATAGAAAPLSLLYSVRCAPHMWLLSGRQSHAFRLAEGEQRSFTLRLLPIASGYLPIPHIDLLEQRREEAASTANKHGAGSVLQRAADKLLHLQQQQQGEGEPASTAPEGAAVSSGGVSYVGIPPARILRHFSPKHQIHVYPPHSFATQMLPM